MAVGQFLITYVIKDYPSVKRDLPHPVKAVLVRAEIHGSYEY
jgi:hypothetical protein